MKNSNIFVSFRIYIQIIKPQLNTENLLDLENNCTLSEKFSIPLKSFLNKGQQNVKNLFDFTLKP